MSGAKLRRRCHAHAADGCRGEIGEDIAKHVLGDDDVEIVGAIDKMNSHRVDEHMFGVDVGKLRRDLVEHPADERVAAQNVRLVAAGHAPPPVGRRSVALARQLENEAHNPLDALAHLDERIDRDFLAPQRASRTDPRCLFSRTIT